MGRNERRYLGLLLPASLFISAALLISLAGCAGSKRENKLRPPAALIISVSISDDRVSSSPSTIGAGPATFKVINLSSMTQRLTVSKGDSERSTGDLDPKDTATIKVELDPGDYELATNDSLAVSPDSLRVTKQRQSSQNDLLLP